MGPSWGYIESIALTWTVIRCHATAVAAWCDAMRLPSRHETDMRSSWLHGTAMGLPCFRKLVGLPWDHHRTTMGPPCDCQGTSIGLIWDYDGTGTGLYGTFIGFPWEFP